IAVCRNPSRYCAPKDLKVIELPVARVAARDEDPAHRVTRTMPKPPSAQLEEARILPENGWEDGPDHEILDRTISPSRPVALAIAGRTLAVTRFAILSLADGRKKSVPRKLHQIELTARL